MIGHVFKYNIASIPGIYEVKLPNDYAICDIQNQDRMICLWAMIDTHAELVTRKFHIIGTGWKIDDVESLYYLKTIQMPDGLVWHMFEQIDD